jgi:heat shock protein HslJ
MMRLYRFVFVGAWLVLATVWLAACATAPTERQTIPAGRVSELWRVVWIDGVGTVTAPVPQWRWVTPEQIQGAAGCTAFTARMVTNMTTVELGPLIPTAAACMPQPGAQEDKFFKALESVRKARWVGPQLEMLDAVGRPVLMLRQVQSP